MSNHRKSFAISRRPPVNRGWVQIAIIAAAVIGAGGLSLILRFPQLGFILIMIAGMFVPFAGPGGLNASILSIVLVLGLWLMDMFVVQREFRFVRSKALRPAAYFMVVCVLAFALGQIPWFTFANQAPLDAQIGGFAIYFFLLATMVMTANLIRDIRWLEIIVWVFVGLGTLYVLGRTLQFSLADSIFRHGFYANSIFWLMLITLPLSQAIFNPHLKTRIRILLFGIVAAAFYVALTQQGDWKSGWVPAAVAAGVLLAQRFKRLALLSIPLVMLVVIYLARDLISTDEYSWGTRLDAWLIVLEISRVSPFIGLGFANYYWYAPLFPIRGYAIRFNSHSQFVDIVAQTGILGLICFLWLLLEVGRLAWKLGNTLPEGFAKAYARGIFAGVFGALMAAFLVDWLLPFAYNIGLEGVRASVLLWIFFGGLISIEQIYLTKSKAIPSEGSEGGLEIDLVNSSSGRPVWKN